MLPSVMHMINGSNGISDEHSSASQRVKSARQDIPWQNGGTAGFGTLLKLLAAGLVWAGMQTAAAAAGEAPAGPPRFFPAGEARQLDDLPAGAFRNQLEALPPAARGKALEWLRGFSFPAADVASLHVDHDGAICYGCHFHRHRPADHDAAEGEAEAGDEPAVALAAVPVSPFPASLVFHSRPGAPNVIYINFVGETVTGTAWNDSLGRTSIPALAFSTDTDYANFSDSEQVAIKRIWQRMAEDYAPFNVNVTTERPATFTTRTAMALITRNTDANGNPNPASTAGGVAYVNVFARTDYAKYRPAWVYHNNLSNVESYIAEAASHEVGHNLGMSHDGTSSLEYYGGHGTSSSLVSWGPIMGTGYDRNVSQWSKGEYYQANNPEDDLAIISGKLSYRTDDHGGTPASATPLTISSGNQILSTTPENDPTNANPANKGMIERNTDVDVFSFVTGSGSIRLQVNPWIQPAGTKGGNLDLLIQLYNESGTLLASSDPSDQTVAVIETSVPEGKFYLHVRNTGAGDPYSSSPTGYTAYGSIGQFFISGFVQDASGFIEPPLAELQPTAPLTQAGQSTMSFTVTYTDNVAVNVGTLGAGDIRVTGPNGYAQLAQFVTVKNNTNGSPRDATYAISPPGGGVWLPQHNGTYTVAVEAGQVADVEGAFAAAGALGQVVIDVPLAYYAANMDTDPGWTLESQWQYGTPSYITNTNGPPSAFTGSKIIAYNLSGNYLNNLSARYATTPAINTTGASSLTLRFMRWLRTRNQDAVSVQASANGTTWTTLWSTTGAVSETSWRAVQYDVPAALVGSPTLRFRWSLSSNNNLNDVGWNIDDVELLGSGSLDAVPPAAALNVANLTLGGSPGHTCGVTYTDATAVRLASLDSTDLLVTGPNGYSAPPDFIGADLDQDGSPITGSYSISAPGGGVWNETHNGTYTVLLQESAVEDTLNNSTPAAALGSFQVAIAPPQPGFLTVDPAGGLTASGPVGGSFSPESVVFTLGNSGGTALEWTAAKTVAWVTLSSTGGTLAPGATASVTVAIDQEAAAALEAGTYEDLVSFTNTTDGAGSTTRAVSLSVVAKEELKVSFAGKTVAGEFRILIQGTPGTAVILEASATLVDWNSIGGGLIGPDGTLIIVDPASATLARRFYRAKEDPAPQG